MRSYQKVLQFNNSKTIVPASFAALGFDGSVKQYVHLRGFAACQAYNFLASVDWWLGFTGNFPQNLTWGTLGTGTRSDLADNGGTTGPIQTGTGLQIANSLFEILDYDLHPLN